MRAIEVKITTHYGRSAGLRCVLSWHIEHVYIDCGLTFALLSSRWIQVDHFSFVVSSGDMCIDRICIIAAE